MPDCPPSSWARDEYGRWVLSDGRELRQSSVFLPVSRELYNNAESASVQLRQYINEELVLLQGGELTDEQQRARLERTRAAADRAEQDRTLREAQRDAYPTPYPVELTVERLADRVGISVLFALHLIQPYCTCSPVEDGGGYDLCGHAQDLNIKADS